MGSILFACLMFTDIASKGLIILFIGLFDNDESPLKNVDELAFPDPNLAVGTVPDVS